MTLDDKGRLQLHSIEEIIREQEPQGQEQEEEEGDEEEPNQGYYVLEKKTKVIREGEVFRCGNF